MKDEQAPSRNYGLSIFNVEGVSVPTAVFGGGNVLVGNCTVTNDMGVETEAIMLRHSLKDAEVGDSFMPEDLELGDGMIMLQFATPESVDVLITALRRTRAALVSQEATKVQERKLIDEELQLTLAW